MPVNKDSYLSLFLNITLFQYDGDPNDFETMEKVLSQKKIIESTTNLPSFVLNGEQLQMHIADTMVN